MGSVSREEERMCDQPEEKSIKKQDTKGTTAPSSPYLRAENEDDDGYDPFSDRPPERDPLFERDPWN